jgi:hypothetical protein
MNSNLRSCWRTYRGDDWSCTCCVYSSCTKFDTHSDETKLSCNDFGSGSGSSVPPRTTAYCDNTSHRILFMVHSHTFCLSLRLIYRGMLTGPGKVHSEHGYLDHFDPASIAWSLLDQALLGCFDLESQES